MALITPDTSKEKREKAQAEARTKYNQLQRPATGTAIKNGSSKEGSILKRLKGLNKVLKNGKD